MLENIDAVHRGVFQNGRWRTTAISRITGDPLAPPPQEVQAGAPSATSLALADISPAPPARQEMYLLTLFMLDFYFR